MKQSATKFIPNNKHNMAIELHYIGKTSKEIADAIYGQFGISIKESSVRRWFMSGGLLANTYQDYAEEENIKRTAIALESMKQLSQIIPNKFSALLNRKDKNGKEKLDFITLNTLKALCDLLNFRILPLEKDNEQDQYNEIMSRLEELAEKKEKD